MRSLFLFAIGYFLIAAVASQPLRDAKTELELARKMKRASSSPSKDGRSAGPKAKRRVEGLTRASEALMDAFSRIGRRLRGSKNIAAEGSEEGFETMRRKLLPRPGRLPFEDLPEVQPLPDQRRTPFRFIGNEAGYTGDADRDFLRAKLYHRPPLYSALSPAPPQTATGIGHYLKPGTSAGKKEYKHFWQGPRQQPRMAIAAAVSTGATLLIATSTRRDQETIQNLNAAVSSSQAQQQMDVQQAVSQDAARSASDPHRVALHRRAANDQGHPEMRLEKRFNPVAAVRSMIHRTYMVEGARNIMTIVSYLPAETKRMLVKFVISASAMASVGGVLAYYGYKGTPEDEPTPPPGPANGTEDAHMVLAFSASDGLRAHPRLYKRTVPLTHDGSGHSAEEFIKASPKSSSQNQLQTSQAIARAAQMPLHVVAAAMVIASSAVHPRDGHPLSHHDSLVEHLSKRMWAPGGFHGGPDVPNPPISDPRATSRVAPLEIDLPLEAEQAVRRLSPKVITAIAFVSTAVVLAGLVGISMHFSKDDAPETMSAQDHTPESPPPRKRGLSSLDKVSEMVKVAGEDIKSLVRKTPLTSDERRARAQRLGKYALVGGVAAAMEAVKTYATYKFGEHRGRYQAREQDESTHERSTFIPAHSVPYYKRDITSASEGSFENPDPPRQHYLRKRVNVNQANELQMAVTREATVDPRWQAFQRKVVEISKDTGSYLAAILAAIGVGGGVTWYLSGHAPGTKTSKPDGPDLNGGEDPLHRRGLAKRKITRGMLPAAMEKARDELKELERDTRGQVDRRGEDGRLEGVEQVEEKQSVPMGAVVLGLFRQLALANHRSGLVSFSRDRDVQPGSPRHKPRKHLGLRPYLPTAQN